MSLLTRIADLITPIGADVKSLQTRLDSCAASTESQQTALSGSEIDVLGSFIAIPQGKIQAGTIYRCKISAQKVSHISAQTTIRVRVGTNGNKSDTARATLAFVSGTGSSDEGQFEVTCIFRSAGATSVIQAMGTIVHRLVTTGFTTTAVYAQILNTGGSFDVTPANLKIGLSMDGAPDWTFDVVTAELLNLAP